MRYEDYQLADFVNDPFFIQWVKNPDPESSTFWQSWLEAHPEKQGLTEQAREILLFLSFQSTQPSAEEHFNVKAAVKNKIRSGAYTAKDKPSSILPVKQVSEIPIRYWRPYYKMIALATGLLFWSAVVLLINLLHTHRTYKTAFGETRTIELPDGSVVTLNANSTLRFSDNWRQTQQREVWLNGEAFFQVRRKPHWKDARFVVYTHKLNIEVLGTEFNVNNRRGMVKVVLDSGKVKLKPAGKNQDSLMMQPREMVEFTDAGQPFVKIAVEPEIYTSWRHHKLIFNETPVREIAQMLEDNYGLQVLFRDEQLASRKFTGAIPNQNVTLFLNILSESLGIQVNREERTIFISK